MSSDEEEVPDRDTAQKLIEQFVAVTGTNEAEAQEFLQERKWRLEPAITFYFDKLAEVEGSSDIATANSNDDSVVEILYGTGKSVTNEPPPRLQLLSWNLDGLDENCLKKRMAAVVTLVRAVEPDVIFFQEVIPDVAEYFERKLPEYKHIRANFEGYFTVTLLRIFTIYYDSHNIVPFPQSMMGRNLLVVSAHIGKRKFTLLNTHLESGKDYAEERKSQLRLAFRHAQAVPNETTVIFGGDLNLRDSEEVVPGGFTDVWKACGARKDAEFTWDMMRNTNHSNFGKFKPRMRFDRIYFRPERNRVGPTVFGLVGAQRAPGTQRFPSDHWGILVNFLLKHS